MWVRSIIGENDFPYHFKKIIVRYKKIGCGMDVMRQTACLVVGPVGVGGFACIFGCAVVGRASGWVAVPSWALLGGGAGGWWLALSPGCLGLGLSWFCWWVSFVVSVGPHVCFFFLS